jgi:o-succinylbenzoate---CoA ligase
MRELMSIDASDPQATLFAVRAALSANGPAVLPRSSMAASAAALPARVEQRTALVVETSGSTARPKLVALTADAVLASAAASESAIGGPGQWLLALPAFYIAGVNVLIRSIVAGTTPVTMDPERFDARRFVAASEELDHPLRFTSLVPAQLVRLVDSAFAHDALRRYDRVLVGGQAVGPELLDRARDIGVNLVVTYGATETCGGCVYDGVPIGAAAARVTDGQLEIAGPMLADGYLDNPERTDGAFYAEAGVRWYRTGDGGAVHDGVVTVTGRLDDVYISGGIKVSLGEVERFIRDHTELPDAVLFTEPDEQWGTVPVVVSTSTTSLEQLRALVVAELGVAAAPSRLIRVAEIPVLPSGKPDRVALREALAR